jgi:predicted nucleic acid-binding protein
MVVSDTGPLISALQSESVGLIADLFGTVHTSEVCISELGRHGWADYLARHHIVGHRLSDAEVASAAVLAAQIAGHPASKEPNPNHHAGEAEAMVLVQRPEFAGAVLLLDELAARAVATTTGLTISGFAGVLLTAVYEGLLAADEIRQKLIRCQQQGTHYSNTFIQKIDQIAREGRE